MSFFPSVICVGFLLGAVFGCTAIEPAGVETWRLVNPNINPPEPIGGATILVTYQGATRSLGHTSPACGRAVLVQTDPDGWFRFPAPGRDVDPVATPYKRGYRMRRFGEGYLNDPVRKLEFLVPVASAETRQQRVEEFFKFNGAAGCAQIGDRGQALADFRKAVLPELKELAQTEADLRLVRNFELAIEDRDTSRR